mgnify:FL=1
MPYPSGAERLWRHANNSSALPQGSGPTKREQIMSEPVTAGSQRLVYRNAEDAEAAAIKNGCSSYHELDRYGLVWYTPDC